MAKQKDTELFIGIGLGVVLTGLGMFLAKALKRASSVSGLALSAGPRDIKDGSGFTKLIVNTKNTDTVVDKSAGVEKVVSICKDIVSKYYQQVQPLADYLMKYAKNDKYQFCKDLFAFCYTYMQYKNDAMGMEQLRTPARSWYDGQITATGIDCDDFSIFCASVLTCKGIRYKFRITKYYGRPNWQHIYCIALIDGKEVIIDPVIDKFDFEKPYSDHKDF